MMRNALQGPRPPGRGRRLALALRPLPFALLLCATVPATAQVREPEFRVHDRGELWETAKDDGTLGGACIADLSLAASAGAALAMMPTVVAKESVDAGELSEGLRDNFYEVANILSRLLNGPSVPHLRISELTPGVPDHVLELKGKAAGLKHYDVTIVDYAGGSMALLAA